MSHPIALKEILWNVTHLYFYQTRFQAIKPWPEASMFCLFQSFDDSKSACLYKIVTFSVWNIYFTPIVVVLWMFQYCQHTRIRNLHTWKIIWKCFGVCMNLASAYGSLKQPHFCINMKKVVAAWWIKYFFKKPASLIWLTMHVLNQA